jgi:hypothetical protein
VIPAATAGLGVTASRMPRTAPDSRQTSIGPGCFPELLRIAAVTPDPLFVHGLDRRSNKEPHDTSRPLPTETPERPTKALVLACPVLQDRADPVLPLS